MTDASINRAFYDIVRLRPRSWQGLADTAHFLQGHYNLAVKANVDFIIDAKSFRAAEKEYGAPMIDALEHYTEAACISNQVYLGALSAAKEDKPGDFTGKEDAAERVMSALVAGELISNFVESARMLVATVIMDNEEERKEAYSLAIQDGNSEKMFDGSQDIILRWGHALDALRPKPETAVEIVRGEIGILPPSIAQSIRDVLNFRPK